MPSVLVVDEWKGGRLVCARVADAKEQHGAIARGRRRALWSLRRQDTRGAETLITKDRRHARAERERFTV